VADQARAPRPVVSLIVTGPGPLFGPAAGTDRAGAPPARGDDVPLSPSAVAVGGASRLLGVGGELQDGHRVQDVDPATPQPHVAHRTR
jgi:hypothetical protein